jgi:uncharacterized protein (DUF488 family)
VIWTVGHGNRGVGELLELLRQSRIRLLIDVRSYPRSRRNPQFNADVLPGELRGAGIDYVNDKRLGGMRQPREDSVNTAIQEPGFRGYADHMQGAEFAAALDDLAGLASGKRVALMCAEISPGHCHRSYLSDALTVRGIEVRHILAPGKLERHRLHPLARPRGDSLTYPGLL